MLKKKAPRGIMGYVLVSRGSDKRRGKRFRPQAAGPLMPGPVLFLDSGVGGIPYCRRFLDRPNPPGLIYLADRAHFPYGSRTKEELVELLSRHIERIIAAYNPVLAVLACNTASVSALGELRRRFPGLPFVGTVPAVKPAVEESVLRSVGILGTERTIADPYLDGLASRYGPDCAIHKAAAPELVVFVEHRLAAASREERFAAAASYVRRFRDLGADAIVLGCTHFLFLLDEFRAAAGPAMKIYDSVEGVRARVEAVLEDRGAAQPSGEPPRDPAQNPAGPERILLLSGEDPPGPVWEDRARRWGMTPVLFPRP
ncbi:MAG: glutamate racemase [Treponema sp.]|jgi:glutamate racemase|nr:glutamate racemase [Treponema sp.]